MSGESKTKKTVKNEGQIQYSGVDAGVYINNMIEKLETLVKKKS